MNKRQLVLPAFVAAIALQAPAQPELTPPELPDSVREQMQNSPPPWSGAVGSAGQLKEPPRLTPPPMPEELLRHGPLVPPQRATENQFDTLERFLELPPQRLAEIRQTIEKIEALDDERKAALLKTLRNSRATTPETSAAFAPLPQHLLSQLSVLPQSQRARLQDKLDEYKTPEARAAFLEGYFHAADLQQ